MRSLVVVCCLSTMCGCSESPGSSDNTLVRAERTELRVNACRGEAITASTLADGFATYAVFYADELGPYVDCVESAASCEEVLGCPLPNPPATADLPTCDGYADSRCDGNTAVLCHTDDDITFREESYDCSLLGATCQQGQGEDGPWAECVVASRLCDVEGARCDGARGVICDVDPASGVTHAREIDCGDVFDSTCAVNRGRVYCEGPAVGEVQCFDGEDNDADGQSDCDDTDCQGHCGT